MDVRIGSDIVCVSRFTERLQENTHAMRRMFTENELLAAQTPESRAGLFAAKEAVIKALDLPAGSWHLIEIEHEPNGRPSVHLLCQQRHGFTGTISISHDGDYAHAVVLFLPSSL